jgi:hypothetical protein
MNEEEMIEDWFVRSVVTGAVHVRRYRTFYAVGLVIAIAVAAVSPTRLAPRAPRGQAAASQSGAVSNAGGPADGADPQVVFTPAELADAAAAPDAAVGAAPDDAGAAPSPSTPDFGAPEAAVPPTPNPAVAAGAPTLAKACDSFGLAMLLVTLAAPAAPVALPLSPVFGAATPVYLACADVPRPETHMVCDVDNTVPAVPGSPVPVSVGAAAAVVDQLRAVESVTGAGSTVSSALASSLGCHPVE